MRLCYICLFWKLFPFHLVQARFPLLVHVRQILMRQIFLPLCPVELGHRPPCSRRDVVYVSGLSADRVGWVITISILINRGWVAGGWDNTSLMRDAFLHKAQQHNFNDYLNLGTCRQDRSGSNVNKWFVFFFSFRGSHTQSRFIQGNGLK